MKPINQTRCLTSRIYPWYSIPELATLTGVSYKVIRNLLMHTPLWSRAQSAKRGKLLFYLVDIQTHCPMLWESILTAMQINDAIKEENDNA